MSAYFVSDQYAGSRNPRKYPEGSIIIFESMKETTIEAENIPNPFLSITRGRTYEGLLMTFGSFPNISESGRISITKKAVVWAIL